MTDLTLTPKQRDLVRTTRVFATEQLSHIRSKLAELDTPEDRFTATRGAYEAAVRQGYLAMQVPRHLGGTMDNLIDVALTAEELIAVESSVPLSLLSTGLGLMPLLFFGTPEQHSEFLPKFTAGNGAPLAGFAFSEPDGTANYRNSDPTAGFTTTARLDGNEWVIRGRKTYTPHARGWDGNKADLFAVAARTDRTRPPQESLAVIIVPGSTPGIRIIDTIDTIGQPGAEVCTVEFADVRVPARNILGMPGDGILIAETAFSGTAAIVGAMSIGVARHAFQVALDFARADHRGGAVPVIEHQNVATILGDMKAKIEACRYLTWKACENFSLSGGGDAELAIASKIFASETAVQIVYDAMRVVGVNSYARRSGLSELLNDALAYPLFDGGNVGVRRLQMQRILAAPNYDPLTAAFGNLD